MTAYEALEFFWMMIVAGTTIGLFVSILFHWVGWGK